jgi:hypothetical protein
MKCTLISAKLTYGVNLIMSDWQQYLKGIEL